MKAVEGKQGNKIWNFSFPSKKKLNVSGLLVLSILCFSSCLDPNLETVADIEESFADITSIEVDAGFLPAQYVGDPDLEEVSLDALLRSNVDGGKTISYRVVGEKLMVSLDNNGVRMGRSEGYIRLAGPSNMSLQMHAGSGTIHAENVIGDRIDLEVNSGRVSAKNLDALEVYLTASSGEVLGEIIKGNTVASVSSGKLKLHQLDGNLDAETSSGNMEFRAINGLLNVKLSSGKITMDQVQALGKVTLSSGQVSGSDVGLSEYTSFKASSGTISIQTNSNLAAFNYEIHTGSGRAKVGESESSGTLVIMNGSPHTIKGEVSSGRITIVN
ncbi:DUF4097 family beta strand repeat-containing protein [Cyclobacterium jeungdonense]|uniref:DUF4097 family beta strand repeat-containing protein n=1 Tax=Cyclobacterium jeungdonense TaxID=708087 RepID=A0ABT8C3K1_9BACT|nr:DUF4097 family beta strand repeat-containing protein [Cyclobacterium jeungdonense]MDN3686340.1 DUF4097 family beta strand repeat-containing protein [Cyclobacterium jeungdonense]